MNKVRTTKRHGGIRCGARSMLAAGAALWIGVIGAALPVLATEQSPTELSPTEQTEQTEQPPSRQTPVEPSTVKRVPVENSDQDDAERNNTQPLSTGLESHQNGLRSVWPVSTQVDLPGGTQDPPHLMGTETLKTGALFGLDLAAKSRPCPDSAIFYGRTCLDRNVQLGPLRFTTVLKVNQDSTIQEVSFYTEYSDWSLIKARDLFLSIGYVVTAIRAIDQHIAYSSQSPFFSKKGQEAFFSLIDSGEPSFNLLLQTPYSDGCCSQFTKTATPESYQSNSTLLTVYRTENDSFLLITFGHGRM